MICRLIIISLIFQTTFLVYPAASARNVPANTIEEPEDDREKAEGNKVFDERQSPNSVLDRLEENGESPSVISEELLLQLLDDHSNTYKQKSNDENSSEEPGKKRRFGLLKLLPYALSSRFGIWPSKTTNRQGENSGALGGKENEGWRLGIVGKLISKLFRGNAKSIKTTTEAQISHDVTEDDEEQEEEEDEEDEKEMNKISLIHPVSEAAASMIQFEDLTTTANELEAIEPKDKSMMQVMDIVNQALQNMNKSSARKDEMGKAVSDVLNTLDILNNCHKTSDETTGNELKPHVIIDFATKNITNTLFGEPTPNGSIKIDINPSTSELPPVEIFSFAPVGMLSVFSATQGTEQSVTENTQFPEVVSGNFVSQKPEGSKGEMKEYPLDSIDEHASQRNFTAIDSLFKKLTVGEKYDPATMGHKHNEELATWHPLKKVTPDDLVRKFLNISKSEQDMSISSEATGTSTREYLERPMDVEMQTTTSSSCVSFDKDLTESATGSASTTDSNFHHSTALSYQLKEAIKESAIVIPSTSEQSIKKTLENATREKEIDLQKQLQILLSGPEGNKTARINKLFSTLLGEHPDFNIKPNGTTKADILKLVNASIFDQLPIIYEINQESSMTTESSSSPELTSGSKKPIFIWSSSSEKPKESKEIIKLNIVQANVIQRVHNNTEQSIQDTSAMTEISTVGMSTTLETSSEEASGVALDSDEYWITDNIPQMSTNLAHVENTEGSNFKVNLISYTELPVSSTGQFENDEILRSTQSGAIVQTHLSGNTSSSPLSESTDNLLFHTENMYPLEQLEFTRPAMFDDFKHCATEMQIQTTADGVTELPITTKSLDAIISGMSTMNDFEMQDYSWPGYVTPSVLKPQKKTDDFPDNDQIETTTPSEFQNLMKVLSPVSPNEPKRSNNSDTSNQSGTPGATSEYPQIISKPHVQGTIDKALESNETSISELKVNSTESSTQRGKFLKTYLQLHHNQDYIKRKEPEIINKGEGTELVISPKAKTGFFTPRSFSLFLQEKPVHSFSLHSPSGHLCSHLEDIKVELSTDAPEKLSGPSPAGKETSEDFSILSGLEIIQGNSGEVSTESVEYSTNSTEKESVTSSPASLSNVMTSMKTTTDMMNFITVDDIDFEDELDWSEDSSTEDTSNDETEDNEDMSDDYSEEDLSSEDMEDTSTEDNQNEPSGNAEINMSSHTNEIIQNEQQNARTAPVEVSTYDSYFFTKANEDSFNKLPTLNNLITTQPDTKELKNDRELSSMPMELTTYDSESFYFTKLSDNTLESVQMTEETSEESSTAKILSESTQVSSEATSASVRVSTIEVPNENPTESVQTTTETTSVESSSIETSSLERNTAMILSDHTEVSSVETSSVDVSTAQILSENPKDSSQTTAVPLSKELTTLQLLSESTSVISLATEATATEANTMQILLENTRISSEATIASTIEASTVHMSSEYASISSQATEGMSTAEASSAKASTAESSTGEALTAEASTAEASTAETSTAEISIAEASTAEISTAEASTAEISSTQIYSESTTVVSEETEASTDNMFTENTIDSSQTSVEESTDEENAEESSTEISEYYNEEESSEEISEADLDESSTTISGSTAAVMAGISRASINQLTTESHRGATLQLKSTSESSETSEVSERFEASTTETVSVTEMKSPSTATLFNNTLLNEEKPATEKSKVVIAASDGDKYLGIQLDFNSIGQNLTKITPFTKPLDMIKVQEKPFGIKQDNKIGSQQMIEKSPYDSINYKKPELNKPMYFNQPDVRKRPYPKTMHGTDTSIPKIPKNQVEIESVQSNQYPPMYFNQPAVGNKPPFYNTDPNKPPYGNNYLGMGGNIPQNPPENMFGIDQSQQSQYPMYFKRPDENKPPYYQPEMEKPPYFNNQQDMNNLPYYNQPEVDKSRFNQPEVDKSRFNQPEVDKSRFNQPEIDKSRFNQPEVDKSRFNQPEVDKLRFNQPGLNKRPYYNQLDKSPQYSQQGLNKPPFYNQPDKPPQLNQQGLNKPPYYSLPDKSPQLNQQGLKKPPYYSLPDKSPQLNQQGLNKPPYYSLPDKSPQLNQQGLNKPPFYNHPDKSPQLNQQGLNKPPLYNQPDKSSQLNQQGLNKPPFYNQPDKLPQFSQPGLNKRPHYIQQEKSQFKQPGLNKPQQQNPPDKSPQYNKPGLNKPPYYNQPDKSPQYNQPGLNKPPYYNQQDKSPQFNQPEINRPPYYNQPDSGKSMQLNQLGINKPPLSYYNQQVVEKPKYFGQPEVDKQTHFTQPGMEKPTHINLPDANKPLYFNRYYGSGNNFPPSPPENVNTLDKNDPNQYPTIYFNQSPENGQSFPPNSNHKLSNTLELHKQPIQYPVYYNPETSGTYSWIAQTTVPPIDNLKKKLLKSSSTEPIDEWSYRDDEKIKIENEEPRDLLNKFRKVPDQAIKKMKEGYSIKGTLKNHKSYFPTAQKAGKLISRLNDLEKKIKTDEPPLLVTNGPEKGHHMGLLKEFHEFKKPDNLVKEIQNSPKETNVSPNKNEAAEDANSPFFFSRPRSNTLKLNLPPFPFKSSKNDKWQEIMQAKFKNKANVRQLLAFSPLVKPNMTFFHEGLKLNDFATPCVKHFEDVTEKEDSLTLIPNSEEPQESIETNDNEDNEDDDYEPDSAENLELNQELAEKLLKNEAVKKLIDELKKELFNSEDMFLQDPDSQPDLRKELDDNLPEESETERAFISKAMSFYFTRPPSSREYLPRVNEKEFEKVWSLKDESPGIKNRSILHLHSSEPVQRSAKFTDEIDKNTTKSNMHFVIPRPSEVEIAVIGNPERRSSESQVDGDSSSNVEIEVMGEDFLKQRSDPKSNFQRNDPNLFYEVFSKPKANKSLFNDKKMKDINLEMVREWNRKFSGEIGNIIDSNKHIMRRPKERHVILNKPQSKYLVESRLAKVANLLDQKLQRTSNRETKLDPEQKLLLLKLLNYSQENDESQDNARLDEMKLKNSIPPTDETYEEDNSDFDSASHSQMNGFTNQRDNLQLVPEFLPNQQDPYNRQKENDQVYGEMDMNDYKSPLPPYGKEASPIFNKATWDENYGTYLNEQNEDNTNTLMEPKVLDNDYGTYSDEKKDVYVANKKMWDNNYGTYSEVKKQEDDNSMFHKKSWENNYSKNNYLNGQNEDNNPVLHSKIIDKNYSIRHPNVEEELNKDNSMYFKVWDKSVDNLKNENRPVFEKKSWEKNYASFDDRNYGNSVSKGVSENSDDSRTMSKAVNKQEKPTEYTVQNTCLKEGPKKLEIETKVIVPGRAGWKMKRIKDTEISSNMQSASERNFHPNSFHESISTPVNSTTENFLKIPEPFLTLITTLGKDTKLHNITNLQLNIIKDEIDGVTNVSSIEMKGVNYKARPTIIQTIEGQTKLALVEQGESKVLGHTKTNKVNGEDNLESNELEFIRPQDASVPFRGVLNETIGELMSSFEVTASPPGSQKYLIMDPVSPDAFPDYKSIIQSDIDNQNLVFKVRSKGKNEIDDLLTPLEHGKKKSDSSACHPTTERCNQVKQRQQQKAQRKSSKDKSAPRGKTRQQKPSQVAGETKKTTDSLEPMFRLTTTRSRHQKGDFLRTTFLKEINNSTLINNTLSTATIEQENIVLAVSTPSVRNDDESFSTTEKDLVTSYKFELREDATTTSNLSSEISSIAPIIPTLQGVFDVTSTENDILVTASTSSPTSDDSKYSTCSASDETQPSSESTITSSTEESFQILAETSKPDYTGRGHHQNAKESYQMMGEAPKPRINTKGNLPKEMYESGREVPQRRIGSKVPKEGYGNPNEPQRRISSKLHQVPKEAYDNPVDSPRRRINSKNQLQKEGYENTDAPQRRIGSKLQKIPKDSYDGADMPQRRIGSKVHQIPKEVYDSMAGEPQRGTGSKVHQMPKETYESADAPQRGTNIKVHQMPKETYDSANAPQRLFGSKIHQIPKEAYDNDDSPQRGTGSKVHQMKKEGYEIEVPQRGMNMKVHQIPKESYENADAPQRGTSSKVHQIPKEAYESADAPQRGMHMKVHQMPKETYENAEASQHSTNINQIPKEVYESMAEASQRGIKVQQVPKESYENADTPQNVIPKSNQNPQETYPPMNGVMQSNSGPMISPNFQSMSKFILPKPGFNVLIPSNIGQMSFEIPQMPAVTVTESPIYYTSTEPSLSYCIPIPSMNDFEEINEIKTPSLNKDSDHVDLMEAKWKYRKIMPALSPPDLLASKSVSTKKAPTWYSLYQAMMNTKIDDDDTVIDSKAVGNVINKFNVTSQNTSAVQNSESKKNSKAKCAETKKLLLDVSSRKPCSKKKKDKKKKPSPNKSCSNMKCDKIKLDTNRADDVINMRAMLTFDTSTEAHNDSSCCPLEYDEEDSYNVQQTPMYFMKKVEPLEEESVAVTECDPCHPSCCSEENDYCQTCPTIDPNVFCSKSCAGSKKDRKNISQERMVKTKNKEKSGMRVYYSQNNIDSKKAGKKSDKKSRISIPDEQQFIEETLAPRKVSKNQPRDKWVNVKGKSSVQYSPKMSKNLRERPELITRPSSIQEKKLNVEYKDELLDWTDDPMEEDEDDNLDYYDEDESLLTEFSNAEDEDSDYEDVIETIDNYEKEKLNEEDMIEHRSTGKKQMFKEMPNEKILYTEKDNKSKLGKSENMRQKRKDNDSNEFHHELSNVWQLLHHRKRKLKKSAEGTNVAKLRENFREDDPVFVKDTSNPEQYYDVNKIYQVANGTLRPLVLKDLQLKNSANGSKRVKREDSVPCIKRKKHKKHLQKNSHLLEQVMGDIENERSKWKTVNVHDEGEQAVGKPHFEEALLTALQHWSGPQNMGGEQRNVVTGGEPTVGDSVRRGGVDFRAHGE